MSKQQPFGVQTVYQIKVKGHLDEHWSEWFDGLTLTYDAHDDTILKGPVIDQSGLYGLLKKAHNLGLTLISVNQVEINAEEFPSSDKQTSDKQNQGETK